MKKRKQKRNIKTILGSKMFLVICVGLVVLFSISVIKETIRKVEINREINELQTEIAAIEDQNQELVDLIDYINSSGWQEKEVKTRLNVKEAGEQVVFIPENNQANSNFYNSNLEIDGNIELADASNVSKWWGYFFSN